LYGNHFGVGVLRRTVDAANKQLTVCFIIIFRIAQGGVQVIIEIFRGGGFVGIVGVVQRCL
jgi:hypothetical protein